MKSLKSFLFPVTYSAIYSIAMLIAFYGGFQNKLNSVSIIGWLLIVPFCVMAMIYAKKTMYNNYIGGKDAAKEGFTFLILSTVLLIVFQTIFFETGFKAYKINFIETYGLELAKTQIANGNLKITEAEIPSLLKKEIEQITLFREITSIIFKNLFLGTITTALTAVSLRAYSVIK